MELLKENESYLKEINPNFSYEEKYFPSLKIIEDQLIYNSKSIPITDIEHCEYSFYKSRKSNVIILFGIGDGQIIEKLKSSKCTELVIIEPYLNIFKS